MLSIVSCNLRCSSIKQNKNIGIEIIGTIQELGMTFYQYGTHTICSYALRSKTIDLDKVINIRVTFCN